MSVPVKNRWYRIRLFLSCLAVLSLTSRPVRILFPRFLILIIAGLILFLVFRRRITAPERRPGPLAWLVMALLTLGFYFTFTDAWRSEAFLRDRLPPGISWQALLAAVAVIGCLFALILLRKLLHDGGGLLRRWEAAAGNTPAERASLLRIRGFLILGLLCLQFFMLQGLGYIYSLDIGFYFVNLAIYLAVGLGLTVLLQRWRFGMLAGTILFSIWGTANHYVLLFHGGPLLLSELANAGTALAVLHGYRFALKDVPWAILAFIVIAARLLKTLWIVDRSLDRAPFWRTLAVRLALLAVSALLPALVLLRPGAVSVLNWSHTVSIRTYGFAPCVIQDAKSALRPFSRPEGYDPARLPAAAPVEAEPASGPDIILILNETFCDLDFYSSVDADRDYMAPFYGIDGAVYGRAVVPGAGGGTNNSEYELLTANSMGLIRAPAPFNFIDFSERNSNAVQYLKRLGYTSCAIHFANASNYSRNTAYPAIGFDDLLLGWPSFPDVLYGNREQMDVMYYDALRRQYDSHTDDAPRFFFVLTYQNHGGYDRNPASLDTVHAQADLGDLTEEVNEYLTSVSLSCEAFRDLVDDLSREDRPVIVCMTGDHAPAFIDSLPENENRSDAERSIAQRTVPYVIWSNYGADLSRCGDTVSLFHLMPMVLRAAGLPLTPYYQAVLSLQDSYPVMVRDTCMDSGGRTAQYVPGDATFAPITDYYFMEYNSLIPGPDYREDLFLPQQARTGP